MNNHKKLMELLDYTDVCDEETSKQIRREMEIEILNGPSPEAIKRQKEASELLHKVRYG